MIRTNLPTINTNTFGTVTAASFNATQSMSVAGQSVLTTAPGYVTIDVGGPANIAANATKTIDYSVAGALSGMTVTGLQMSADPTWDQLQVSFSAPAINVVRVTIVNLSASTVTYNGATFSLKFS